MTVSVPLLFQVRLVPKIPPVTFEVVLDCVVKVEATVASMLPADQLKVLPDAKVIAPAPVTVLPLSVVVPLKLAASDRVSVPAVSVVGPMNVEVPPIFTLPPLIVVELPKDAVLPMVRVPPFTVVVPRSAAVSVRDKLPPDKVILASEASPLPNCVPAVIETEPAPEPMYRLVVEVGAALLLQFSASDQLDVPAPPSQVITEVSLFAATASERLLAV